LFYDEELKMSPSDLIEALYRINGKAEIVNGEMVMDAPAGGRHGRAAAMIFMSLLVYEKAHGGGRALPDNVGFIVDLPHRQSFSPDAAFHVGELTMKFPEGAPVFAAEIRSEGDYGPASEEAVRQKRVDYFAAGSLVVWDVDLLGNDVVHVYRSESPDTPTIYGRGKEAEAEPALPGWKMSVDELFD
jgi:Uma2 family endonuclease